MPTRPAVLMISKPVAPPWNDSSKNLVKDLAVTGRAFRYHVLTPKDFRLDAGSDADIVSEPLYASSGAHTPGLLQNLRVLARLFRRDNTTLTHFFFAPNPKTSGAARFALMVRARPTIQTVCSCPSSFAGVGQLLFADHVVVVSEHARQAFIGAGVDPARLTVIPPGIQIPQKPTADVRAKARQRFGLPEDDDVVIYPGDYQFSQTAETVARAVVRLRERRSTTFVFACRIKQEASKAKEQQIRQELAAAGVQGVRFFNQVDDMLSLLAACDLCLLPAESLYAKMDLPLVLIEAMALGVPIVVADRPPLSELLVDEVGVAVPAGDAEAIVSAVTEVLDNPGRRATLAAAGQRAAPAHFGIENISRRYENLYREVLRR